MKRSFSTSYLGVQLAPSKKGLNNCSVYWLITKRNFITHKVYMFLTATRMQKTQNSPAIRRSKACIEAFVQNLISSLFLSKDTFWKYLGDFSVIDGGMRKDDTTPSISYSQNMICHSSSVAKKKIESQWFLEISI